MAENIKVLIVDDEVQVCQLLTEALTPYYTCRNSHSAIEALEIVDDFHPHVILLDINMPQMDGLEACKAIKTKQLKHDCAVFLISGQNTLDMKLKAFDVGADDFIAKPFQIVELVHKVKLVADYIISRTELEFSEKESRTIAIASMQQASQYSYVMNFFKAMGHAVDIDEVISLFFNAMNFFELRASIMVNHNGIHYFDHSHNQISPIEQNIYELLASKSRLYEFGNRLLVNDKHVSFLVKNMPQSDEMVGQVRDFVATMIEGIEAKLEDLRRQEVMLKVVSHLKHTVEEVREGVNQHSQMVSSIMTDMIGQIAASFHQLDMTEEQETFFTSLVEHETQKLGSMEDLLINIQAKLEQLVTQAEKVSKRPAPVEQPQEAIDTEPMLF